MVLASAALTAACGSTVQVTGNRALTDGLQIPGGETGAPVSERPLGPGTGPTSWSTRGPSNGGGGTTGGASTGGGAGDSQEPLPSASGALRLPGVTPTEIRIGFATQKDADGSAVGIKLDFGDAEAQARAAADEVNRTGGILGRKVVVVVHDDQSVNDTENPTTSAQAQCEDWTRDHPVFAAISLVASRNTLNHEQCMARARVAFLPIEMGWHSVREYARNAPFLFGPGVAALERWTPALVDALVDRKYFTGWDNIKGGPGPAPVKIATLFPNNETGQAFYKSVSTALASHHLALTDHFAYSTDQATSLREIPSIVLRFRNSKVTHVILPEGAAVVLPVAENQRYRPRWGLTSLDGPDVTLTTVRSSGAEAQLQGALGLGWAPGIDVEAEQDPGPTSSNTHRCLAAMKRSGQAGGDRTTELHQLSVCEGFFFLQAALNRAGSLSFDALQRGAAALGAGYGSTMTFSSLFSMGRFDGVASGRDFEYNATCTCFRYLDRVNRPMP